MTAAIKIKQASDLEREIPVPDDDADEAELARATAAVVDNNSIAMSHLTEAVQRMCDMEESEQGKKVFDVEVTARDSDGKIKRLVITER